MRVNITLQTVTQFLSSPKAKQALQAAHVNPTQVKTAVSNLSDEEVAQLASRVDKAQADFAAGNMSDRDLILILLADCGFDLGHRRRPLELFMFRSVARLVVGLSLGGMVLAGQQPGVWLDVPFVRQEKNGCGAASIAMVMQYWQRQQGNLPSADPEQIQRALYSRPAQGIYASDMERYFQQHGFRTFAFAGEWKD